ncbi:uncharacterized protein B0H64DRAFT_438565 [Chaetomium fimeti]|uniref:Uncharacterized protein n=1 Tax=Chaetomium fimeti TaxID=1854472 RepID=A0AAE0LXS0_9PEZI|nr:hypothetical protein B0H64DRAFT_438565 [Chaetomium fimeti]
MGKSKMDDAAAERIRRARGDKDAFSKRAADAARRNDGGQDQHASSSKSGSVGSKANRESGAEKK